MKSRSTKTLAIIAALVVCVIVGVVLVHRHAETHKVSATFLCYTNVDTQGWNSQYTWAWFEIENTTSSAQICQLDHWQIHNEDVWATNDSSRGYDYGVVMPGEKIVAELVAPADGSEWRCAFSVRKTLNPKNLKYRLEWLFFEKGWKRTPPMPSVKSTVILSDTIAVPDLMSVTGQPSNREPTDDSRD